MVTLSQDEALPPDDSHTSRRSVQGEVRRPSALPPVNKKSVSRGHQDKSPGRHRSSTFQTGPGDDPSIQTNSMLKTSVTYVDSMDRC